MERSSEKTNLCVQLWSTLQDKRALDLLNFPGPPLVTTNPTIRASAWGTGRNSAVRGQTSRDVIARLSERTMNQVKIRYIFQTEAIPRVEDVLSILDLSPTSSLWAKTLDFETDSASAENARASFGSYERSLEWNGVVRAPTLLESHITFSSGQDYDAVFELLVVTLELVPVSAVTGGCADMDRYPRAGHALMNLSPWKRGYPQLESKWDALHPIMIGRFPRCQEFARLAASFIPLRLAKVGSQPDQESLGVLQLFSTAWHYREAMLPQGEMGKYAVWGEPSWYDWVRAFIVPRDDTTRHRL